MKKYFLESSACNMVGLLFDDGMVAFECVDIDDAINFDFSGIECCETAEEAAFNCNVEPFSFNENEWECATLIYDYCDRFVVVPESYILTTGCRYIGRGDICYFGELSDGSASANACIHDLDKYGIGDIAITNKNGGEYLVVFRVIELDSNNDYLDSIVEVVNVEEVF